MTKEKIQNSLENKIPVYFYDVTDSTNLRAREHILKNGCQRAVFVANGQSAGRGRLGRDFYSPVGTGVYMTYAMRVDGMLCDAVRITTAAAVSVAEAIGERAKIKWVNDVYVDEKKVCGILTEAIAVGESLYVIIGIGINVTTECFPDGLNAASIGDTDKSVLVAKICDSLKDVQTVDYIDRYRARLLWKNQPITYTENNQSHHAILIDADDEGHLIVEQNGNKKTLRSGEISIRSK